MEIITNPEIQNLPPITPQNNNYKILFFIFLALFLIISTVLVTLLITQKSFVPAQTANIQETKSITSVPSEITIIPTETATTSTKTSFQKLILNFSLYKETTATEKKQFTDTTGFWTGSIESDDTLYAFVQELIKGSIKKLTVSKANLSTILGDYEYTFYLTPNYQKWTTDQFIKNTKSKMTGIGDMSPLYASTDKLIWTTSYASSCGGARSDDINKQKAQDQCKSLVKEIETTF